MAARLRDLAREVFWCFCGQILVDVKGKLAELITTGRLGELWSALPLEHPAFPLLELPRASNLGAGEGGYKSRRMADPVWSNPRPTRTIHPKIL